MPLRGLSFESDRAFDCAVLGSWCIFEIVPVSIISLLFWGDVVWVARERGGRWVCSIATCAYFACDPLVRLGSSNLSHDKRRPLFCHYLKRVLAAMRCFPFLLMGVISDFFFHNVGSGRVEGGISGFCC